MSEKSHASLEQHVCLVCGTAFDTGRILLDKRLRACMEHHTTTGWGSIRGLRVSLRWLTTITLAGGQDS